MFEGKEIEGKIGDIGDYLLDVDDKGFVTAAVGVKIDLIAQLEKIAAKTNNKIDDTVLAYLKKFLGRV